MNDNKDESLSKYQSTTTDGSVSYSVSDNTVFGEDRDDLRKRLVKLWRILDIMKELEQNSFIKMFSDGWCATCDFEAATCAEQRECQAYKVIEKVIDNENKKEDEQ